MTLRGRFPNDCSALDEAVDILGPFPSPAERENLGNWVLQLDPDYTPPSTISDPEAARAECRRIGQRFRAELQRELTSPRLSDVTKRVGQLEDLTGRIGRIFASMRTDEYRVLITASSKQLRAGFDADRLVPLNLSDTEPSSCPLGKEVEQATSFLSQASAALAGKDRGGATNATRILAGSAHWQLVHLCWRLFESLPHLQPTTTAASQAGGRLDRFVSAINEWITADHRSFLPTIKAYSRIRKRYTAVAARFAAELKRLGYRSFPQLQMYLDQLESGQQPMLRRPTPELQKAAREMLRIRFELANGFEMPPYRQVGYPFD